MKTFIQTGDVITATAPSGGVASGDGVLIGEALFGVASFAAAEGSPVEIDVTGVFDLPKAAGAVDAGDRLHWDAATKKLTTTAGGNPLVGFATEAALSGAATARVRLLGQALATEAA